MDAFSPLTRTVLIAAGDDQAAAALVEDFTARNWHVIGPFPNTHRALQWLSINPVQGSDGALGSAAGLLDLALVDALMADGAALRLSLSLRRRGIRTVFFTSFDVARRRLRAEFPDCPGLSREASVPDLLQAIA